MSQSAFTATKRNVSVFMLAFLLTITIQHHYLLALEKFPQTVDFDRDWKFKQGDFPQAVGSGFNDHDWRKLDLPHDWSIEGMVDRKNPSGNDGGYFPNGIGWYRKEFLIDRKMKGKESLIYFEGVYMYAEVFINGVSLGVRPYGYSSFMYDMSPYLNYGGKNVVCVKVDNSKQKNSRWYSGSGIYRHVKLYHREPIHFATWGVKTTTERISTSSWNTDVAACVVNSTNAPKTLSVTTSILNQEGKKLLSKTHTIRISGKDSLLYTDKLNITNPNLWSVESPDLYKIELTIEDSGVIKDQYSKTFGYRTIEFTTSDGFALNGKKIKLNGGCVHHDNGALGAAAYDRAEFRKVELLKSAGFNAVRTSHNPPSEAFLDACDQLGMLVIDECFDGWRTKKNTFDYATYFDKWWIRDVTDWVLRDRHHPSVILWSTGNEIIERKEPQAVQTAMGLTALVHKLDSTRPVTSAITTWDNSWTILDPLFKAHDVGGYNYQLHRAVADHERVPDRIIVQTESYPRDAFKNWKLVNDHSYILGDFVWTAMDYLGEAGIGRYFYDGETKGETYNADLYPWHGAYSGDIDLMGGRKPISHYREMLYNPNKKLYMAVKEPDGFYGKINETLWSVWPTWESWTWPGLEGKPIEVEVYSRYPKVRLFLNDQLIGEQSTGVNEQFKATFKVPYSAGRIEAVGVEENNERGRLRLETAGDAYQIMLVADRTVFKANGQDLVYLKVEIRDKNGILQPNAVNEIDFKISGPAKIIAVDNANLKDTAPYVASKRKAWNGRAMAIVKSTYTTGRVSVRASAVGLKGAEVILKCN